MSIREEAKSLAEELIQTAGMKSGDLLVVGCSTSEILGKKIGTASVPECAVEVYEGIAEAAKASGIELAAQCCEHLNRALIVERSTALRRGYEIVCVVPKPKAGGSFATAAYARFADPVAVEHIRAEAGMDIGDTLIGMHLRDVAVPVRLSVSSLGDAHVVCARTRPKYIGGPRAVYE